MKARPADDLVFAEERKRKTLELLRDRKKLTVSELTDLFRVSSTTIRTDLRELETAGALTRTHGGAIERYQTGFELIPKRRQVQNLQQKRAIAARALELVNDGDRIILDTGTTALELARLLGARINITVLTNDIDIARTLEDFPSVEVFLFGGLLRKQFHCTIATQGESMLGHLIADKAFMGANSLSLGRGATTPDISHAEMKKAMIASANKLIILCDSSKIGKVSFARFAHIREIDTLVTDQLSDSLRDKFEDHGVEVIS